MMFDHNMLSAGDKGLLRQYIGTLKRDPDFVIMPDGKTPYLYRWYLVPKNKSGNVYLHIQTASDPERPLHDHPWDNQSVILAGGYMEQVQQRPPNGPVLEFKRMKGSVVQRRAGEPHRLLLPTDVPYTMSLFTTGPVLREWGFWTADGWANQNTLIRTTPAGVSVYLEPGKHQ